MADAADVRSLDAIREVRQALCAFEEEARNALLDVEFDIKRTREWLSNEQRLYWQSEIKRWEQKLDVARGELMRKRLGRFLDRKPDTSQEEKAVRHAEERLEECHRKLAATRRWSLEFLRDMQEYQSQAQPLADMLDRDVARGLSALGRMMDAIEAYAALAPPEAAPGAGEPGAGGSMARPVEGAGNVEAEAAATLPGGTAPDAPGGEAASA